MKVTEILSINDTSAVSLPYFEVSVAAGNPTYVSESFESTINVSQELIKNRNSTFCVRVNGQSMVDAGIDDGDLLIVDKSLPAANNNIILAVIDGEFTVKRLYRRDDDLYLQPENKNYAPIKITEFMDFRIWGVVTGLIKKLL